MGNTIQLIEYGGYLRIFNMANLVSDNFKTTIFTVDKKVECHDKIKKINIIQRKQHSNLFHQIKYEIEGLFSHKFSPVCSDLAFNNVKDNVIFQIELPYFINLLKKNKIENYILDEQNVYFDMMDLPSFNLKSKIYNNLAFNKNKKIELKAIKNAKHVFTCSEIDRLRIIKEFPECPEKITVVPNCVNLSEYRDYKPVHYRKENDGYNILFIGTLLYPPNLDAFKLICNKIAPNLDSDFTFTIIGKNPPNINKPDNVEVLGYVKNIKDHIWNSDICIAPLRYGGGTRLKILEYMAMKKPVISTSKGAEGIDFTNNKNIIIEDQIEEFPSIIKNLSNDEKRRHSIGMEGFKLIERNYDWKIYQNILNDVYDEVLNASV